MSSFDLKVHPHKRFNPLLREWVLVSPHRAERPWQGQVEGAHSDNLPSHDPQCYLCPGNQRAGGVRNPDYTQTFVFDNDFAALRADAPDGQFCQNELLIARSEKGRCRVVCFSPRHDLTLARMALADVQRVVETWTEEFVNLSREPNAQSVQIFENRGAMMGCSNPHPHGQIWVDETLPDLLQKELTSLQDYFGSHSSSLLQDYLAIELQKQDRIVQANDHFVALVPFWAVWPFETLLISRRRVSSLPELRDDERKALAAILQRMTIRYDNLFRTSFPYTMGFHQLAPELGNSAGFHLHAHFCPPLLRSATVKKFMVGYELLAMPQRDITPESAAELLKQAANTHYLEKTI
jgi:UDPglucose--hexose-1-phosphate uridylyltransferase